MLWQLMLLMLTGYARCSPVAIWEKSQPIKHVVPGQIYSLPLRAGDNVEFTKTSSSCEFCYWNLYRAGTNVLDNAQYESSPSGYAISTTRYTAISTSKYYLRLMSNSQTGNIEISEVSVTVNGRPYRTFSGKVLPQADQQALVSVPILRGARKIRLSYTGYRIGEMQAFSLPCKNVQQCRSLPASRIANTTEFQVWGITELYVVIPDGLTTSITLLNDSLSIEQQVIDYRLECQNIAHALSLSQDRSACVCQTPYSWNSAQQACVKNIGKQRLFALIYGIVLLLLLGNICLHSLCEPNQNRQVSLRQELEDQNQNAFINQ